MNIQSGKVDKELERKFKKHRNYSNKMIKRAVRENAGKNISNDSSVKEIWSSINDILRPEMINKKSLKIEIESQVIEDPHELAEKFNIFSKEKAEKLAEGIKKNSNIDPLLKLREKMNGSDLKFKLRTVKETEVLKIIRQMKSKQSYGHYGISSEILKLGAKVLVIPLTYIINTSILTGKYPTDWKLAKIVPIHKKGEKSKLKNYRPVSLLCIPGMTLERVVALQVEEYFERNELLGKFQFGFRRNKSTISELLTLFDTLLEAKDEKKEILILLYDLSAAFDTVSHYILLEKLCLYGFDNFAVKWTKSYLEDRKQKVTVAGKFSSAVKVNRGTPQGSRLSPLLFIILMADLDMWMDKSILSNFADDTQSIIINEDHQNLLELTRKEANSFIKFFESNNLVNNAEKSSSLIQQ